MNKVRPDDSWSVEQLGEFCSFTHQKMAIDAWRFGHALNLAFAKQNHGEWKIWKAKYVPYLKHSSEHRYRTLAAELSEDSLVGVGLTEAYRLLDLTYTKGKNKEGDDLFPGAPVVVTAGSGGLPPEDPSAVATESGDSDDDGSDDFDGLLEPAVFDDPPPAAGLILDNAEETPPSMSTGPMEVEAEPEDVTLPPATAPLDDGSVEERYRLSLAKARHQMQCLRSWADWLMGRKVASLSEMCRKHGVAGVVDDIDLTIGRLRWVREHLP